MSGSLPTFQSENAVEAEVLAYLKAHGWQPRRQHVGVFYTPIGTPIRIGRRGACDWTFVRTHNGQMQYFEAEIKATKRQPSKAQREYVALMRHQGFKAGIFHSLAELETFLEELGWND